MKTHLRTLLLIGISTVYTPFMANGADVPPSPGLDSPLTASRFDLDFSGGTPSDLLAAIAKSKGSPVNAILPRDANDYLYPSMSIRSVTVEDIFNALSSARFLANSEDDGTFVTSHWSAINPKDPTAIWSLSITKGGKEKKSGVELYQLEHILGDSELKVEDVTFAIQSAWEMAGIEDNAEMKFHEETKLLIVKGDAEAIRILDKVILSLRQRSSSGNRVTINRNPVSLNEGHNGKIEVIELDLAEIGKGDETVLVEMQKDRLAEQEREIHRKQTEVIIPEN